MTSLDRPGPFLGPEAPVPIDRPFTRAEALGLGATDRQLRAWCTSGVLMNPIRGVYHSSHLPDGLELRLACLALVVPEDAVVTDRTAGWLHGASMVLAPNDHLRVPPVSVFRQPGYRLRNDLVVSGERSFAPGEVVDLGPIRVTSPLRTACDLGRMPNREHAYAAMNAVMSVGGFTTEELVGQGARFKGYRRVRQFYGLAPFVDGRCDSPPEYVLRLRWLDCTDLPAPEPQVPVRGPDGTYYLDLGVREIRYGVEYYGDEWHGPDREEHDDARCSWMVDQGDWAVDIFRVGDVFGPVRDVETRLRAGVAASRRRTGARAWRGQDRGVG